MRTPSGFPAVAAVIIMLLVGAVLIEFIPPLLVGALMGGVLLAVNRRHSPPVPYRPPLPPPAPGRALPQPRPNDVGNYLGYTAAPPPPPASRGSTPQQGLVMLPVWFGPNPPPAGGPVIKPDGTRDYPYG
jgi:hypothetical protein